MQDLAARTGTILAEGAEPLTLMPYTAGDEALRQSLERGDTVVVYKGGRHLPRVLDAIRDAGRIDEAVYGEQLGSADEECSAAAARTAPGPYLSTVIVPARRNGARGEKL
jgi:precorrin-2/cobalt-factor-2 C20-methyltransferase